MRSERPFIVRFENQTDAYTFDVVINSDSCSEATEWARGYFGQVTYLHSDFDGNHTYHRERQGIERLPE
jgi:hypothetical protein